MSLIYIAQQCTLYVGIALFTTGIFGNAMNIYIFTSVPQYLATPSTHYFLIGSICNLVYIILNLIPRIFNTTYGINFASYSVAWCKLQQFFIGFLSLTSLNCSCLATIDQYFVTSKIALLRRFSHIKWAHRITYIIIIIWILHAVPPLIFYGISPISKSCVNTNPTYAAYMPVYILGLLSIVPVSVMIIFGFLTYRNISQTIALAEQQADRQLVRMIFIQVVLVVISMSPFGIFVTYNLITTGMAKDPDRQIKEYFASIIFILFSYLYYVGNFYMFLIASKRFRRTFRDRIMRWRQHRIEPSATQQTDTRRYRAKTVN